jgi:polar amino acid transport system substrate-binding protein
VARLGFVATQCGSGDDRRFPIRPLWAVVLFAWATGLLMSVQADTMTEIRSRGALRWGDDAEGGAPYIFHAADDPQKLVGLDVEFAAALAERLGVRSEFVQYNWGNLVPALLQGGSFDVIIAALERTPENLAKVELSRPYLVFGQQLVVRAGETNIRTLDDLRGRSVGVLTATTSHHLAEKHGGVAVKVYDDNVNYFRDLELGRVDAVLTDSPIAQVNLTGNTRLRPAGPMFEPGFYSVGIRPGDTNLLAEVDRAIEAMIRDGTMERIGRRYDVWGPEQAALTTWQAPVSTVRKSRSALREWRRYLPILLEAAVTTLWVTCAGMVLAVVLGLTLALLKVYGMRPVRWLAGAYIEVFRGTPLLLQLYFIYFGLAQQLGWKLGPGAAAVLTLGLNYAACEAENYRAGLQAVPRGQTEAALALGMTPWLTLRRILLPQALRISLPSVTNDFIAMFKDSSIVSVIGLVELTKQFLIRSLDTGDYLGLGVLTAGLYFVMGYAASLGARAIERRLHT